MLLAPANVRWVVVFEGVNDLGGLARNGEVSQAEHAALVLRLLSAYSQVITRAHAHGLRVYGATITPYVGSNYYHPGALSESDRQAVNQWIRSPGHFDAVIDFDAVGARSPASRTSWCRSTIAAITCILLLPVTRRWEQRSHLIFLHGDCVNSRFLSEMSVRREATQLRVASGTT